MRRFRFTLARVLRVRRLQEEQARAALLEARARSDAALRAAEDVRAELASGRVHLAALQARPELSPAQVIVLQRALEGTRRALVAREDRARELERATEDRRVAWEATRTTVRGLERLEVRRRTNHAAELERAEARTLDELALARGTRSGPRAPRRDDGGSSLPTAPADDLLRTQPDGSDDLRA